MTLYTIFYPRCNVTQTKILIPHSVYEKYRDMPQDSKKQIKAAKEFLGEHTKGLEWFTDGSPLYAALETGILKLGGYEYPCKLTKISYE